MVLPAQATRARRDLRTPPLTRRSWLMLACWLAALSAAGLLAAMIMLRAARSRR